MDDLACAFCLCIFPSLCRNTALITGVRRFENKWADEPHELCLQSFDGRRPARPVCSPNAICMHCFAPPHPLCQAEWTGELISTLGINRNLKKRLRVRPLRKGSGFNVTSTLSLKLLLFFPVMIRTWAFVPVGGMGGWGEAQRCI